MDVSGPSQPRSVSTRENRRPIGSAYRDGPVPAIAISPTALLATGCDHTWIERVEYRSELEEKTPDVKLRTYPAPTAGAVRALGWALSTDAPVKVFHADRELGVTALATFERWDGEERFDIRVEGRSGPRSVTVRGSPVDLDISPDGSSIAVLSWSGGGVVTRRVVLLANHRDGLTHLARGDLETGEQVSLGELEWPNDLPALKGNRHVFDIEVSPAGTEFLGRTYFAETNSSHLSHSDHVGGRTKWVRGTLPLHGAGNPMITAWPRDWYWQGDLACELEQ